MLTLFFLNKIEIKTPMYATLCNYEFWDFTARKVFFLQFWLQFWFYLALVKEIRETIIFLCNIRHKQKKWIFYQANREQQCRRKVSEGERYKIKLFFDGRSNAVQMPVNPYESGASSARLRPQQGKMTPIAATTWSTDDIQHAWY